MSTRIQQRYRQLLRLCGVGLLLTILLACSEPPYTNVSNDELRVMLHNDVPIYDVRRPEEWLQTGVVAGSKLLTFVDASGRVKPDFLGRFIAENEKDDAVILICRTGSRTRTLARYLAEELGYTQVYNVRSGITRWIASDNPVIRP